MDNHLANIFDPIEHELDQSIFRGITPRRTVVKFIRDKFFDKMSELVPNPQFHFQLVLTGSLTTYQYSDTSDADISVIPDYPQLARFIDSDPNEIRRALVRLVTSKLDGTFLPGTSHPLQYFVIPDGDDLEARFAPGVRSGYDLVKEEWINPPEPDRVHNVQAELPELYSRAEQMADKMRLLIGGAHDDEAKELFALIHAKRSLDENEGLGDFSEGNIVYKYLLHEGIFDQLRGLGVKIAWNPFKTQQPDVIPPPEENPYKEMGPVPDPFAGSGRYAFFVMPNGNILCEGSWHTDITARHPGAEKEALFAGALMNFGGRAMVTWGSGSYGLMPTQEQASEYMPYIEDFADSLGVELEKIPPVMAAGKLYYHTAPKSMRQSIELHGLDPSYDQTGMGAIFLDTKPTWSDEMSDVWRIYPRNIHVETDITTPGMGWYMTYDKVPPVDLELLEAPDLEYIRTAKTRIIYNFNKDVLVLTDDDIDDHIKEADHVLVGTYGDGKAHLNNDGKQFLNANYFKRLWLTHFPSRELSDVYVDDVHVPTRDDDMMTYTQKNPIVVHNPAILSKLAKEKWRKGEDWRDFIKNKGIIVEFQIGDKKDESFDGRVKDINKNGVTVEVAPGETRRLSDDLLDSMEFRVRDDKRALSHWKEAVITDKDLKWNAVLETYPWEGCFGYIGGQLLIGTAHHQEIMAALFEAGWSWTDLMNAPQAWGWYEFIPEYAGENWYDNPVVDDEEFEAAGLEYVAKGSYVSLSFASDAGTISKSMLPKTRQAFRNLTGVKVDGDDDYGSGITDKADYGTGLGGNKERVERPGYGRDVIGPIPPAPSSIQ